FIQVSDIPLLDVGVPAKELRSGKNVGSYSSEFLPGGQRGSRNELHIPGDPLEELGIILLVTETHADT
ncbi:hypothetical protein NPIL_409991, partial [Nephila pilipes]